MPSQPINGLPGVKTERTSSYRNVVLSDPRYFPGGVIIDGSKSRDPLNTGDLDVLRPGLVLGEITTSGKYAPAILGVTTEAYDNTDSSSSENQKLKVSAATATEINRRIGSSGTFTIAGPPTAGGTVATETVTFSAVNTTTGVITVTDLGTDYVVGSLIQPTDGSQNPKVLIPDELREGNGVKVTDQDDEDIDTELALPLIGGVVDASQIINYPADASLKTWLKGKLNGGDGTEENTGAFVFDDRYV